MILRVERYMQKSLLISQMRPFEDNFEPGRLFYVLTLRYVPAVDVSAYTGPIFDLVDTTYFSHAGVWVMDSGHMVFMEYALFR